MMSLGLVYEGVAFCVFAVTLSSRPCWLVSYSCSCCLVVSSASNAALAWARATPLIRQVLARDQAPRFLFAGSTSG